ncbi:helix-turn-helix domain-containing protein [Massilia phyllosphaerae]|uniref:helix-turn-helix domain-containing protein n=1 Tax=Massilia phyllosphaerae TaxID=3106034 RepID=UPI002B1CE075|nr:helix-turn-helix transcriptional regulator [Massilia sp. SGZ-792]
MKKTEQDPLCRQFGENLAKIRHAQNFSQLKLSLDSGLARSYIGDIERGVRNPTLVNIFRIADTLKVDVRVLFEFERKSEDAVVARHAASDNTSES